MSARTSTGSEVEVRPLTPHIGAEIGGVDLAAPGADEVVTAVRAALLRHRVVFFRDQTLGPRGQVAWARRFGPLTASHPTLTAGSEHPAIHDLDSAGGTQANYWHTDVTFIQQPPAISVLRSVVLPPLGGDTLWASTVAAYEGLLPEHRQLADSLDALHTNVHDYAIGPASSPDPDQRANGEARRAEHVEQFRSQRFETSHPVVSVHPETGERALLLGGFAARILGLAEDRSAELLAAFADQVTRPEHGLRWRWRPGDVAMWDNRSTQHYAVFDYAPQRRQMQRVTVAGHVPVGVDGRHSRAMAGDASAYLPEVAA